jgi:uncharacterized protein (DUF1501 family)
MLRAMALGCSAAASPLVTPVSFAAAPWDNRLVVIILRGAMDGLDVLRPIEDPLLREYRPDMVTEGQVLLGGGSALHPALAPLGPMWDAGELAFAHAVSTPYRDKRSHFDGQDLLEAGYPTLPEYANAGRSGWLNRMLTLVPDATSRTAFSVGLEDMILLNGTAPISSWSPGQALSMSDQGLELLQMLYEEDPLFHAAASDAIELTSAGMGSAGAGMSGDEGEMMSMGEAIAAANQGRRAAELGRFAAQQLNAESRIAAFSIGGYDTHRLQNNALPRALTQLVQALEALKETLGSNWSKTAVLCMTEFGRTVHQNGTKGTDHGTGGAMLMAGGAVRGGRIYGRWPGLGEQDLYENRDLLPTMDVRGFAAHAMQDLFGFGRHDLENTVFPGLDLSDGQKFIL